MNNQKLEKAANYIGQNFEIADTIPTKILQTLLESNSIEALYSDVQELSHYLTNKCYVQLEPYSSEAWKIVNHPDWDYTEEAAEERLGQIYAMKSQLRSSDRLGRAKIGILELKHKRLSQHTKSAR